MRERVQFLVVSFLTVLLLFFTMHSVANSLFSEKKASFGSTVPSGSTDSEKLDERVVTMAKRATVLIKVGSSVRKCTGSGFVFKKVDDVVYIATNAHVIEKAISGDSRIRVVLEAGSRKESTVSAEIVGIDPENDVAILSIIAPNHKSVFSLEKISFASETMGIFVLGFPFGTSLSTSSHSPAVTVSRGWISSIRKDDNGNVKLIQIDASINPGNSGGPVIDGEGNLFGLAFAKISESQIGFVVPIQRLIELLNGKITHTEITSVLTKKLKASVHVKFLVLDPFHQIQQIRISYSLINSKHVITTKPLSRGYWTPLRQEEKTKIVNAHWAGMNGYATLVLPSKKGLHLLVQPEIKSMGGTVHAMEAILLEAPLQSRGISAYGQTKKSDALPHPSAKRKDGNWLGGGNTTPSYKPHSTLQFGPLKVQEFPVLDARVTMLPIENTADNMFWADNGNYLVVATKNGVVYKIPVSSAMSGEVLIRRFDTNIKHFAKSSLGFVILNDKMQEINLIRESDLASLATIPVGSCRLLTASPHSNMAFISEGRSELKLVDLKKRAIERTFYASNVWQAAGSFIRKHKSGVVLINWASIQMTQDGRYLFCASLGSLSRFRIKGNDIIYEEMGPGISNSGGRIEISPDSSYVSLIEVGGNRKIDGYPQINYGIYIFKSSDLQNPVLSVIPGAYPTALAFDSKNSQLYSANFEKNLLRFDSKGNIIREYKLDKRGNQTIQLLTHPHENMLAVRTEKHIFLVRF
jgi:S1-C subfamily serine protease